MQQPNESPCAAAPGGNPQSWRASGRCCQELKHFHHASPAKHRKEHLACQHRIRSRLQVDADGIVVSTGIVV